MHISGEVEHGGVMGGRAGHQQSVQSGGFHEGIKILFHG